MTAEPDEPDAFPPRPIVEHLADGRTLVAVRDLRLARRHFEIRRQDEPEGAVRYFVRDLDSHCGTPINGRRVDAGWHELTDGDVLLFTMFRFRLTPRTP